MRAERATVNAARVPQISTLNELAAFLSTGERELERLVAEAPRLYTQFEQPKRSGGVRTIRPPRRVLRSRQRVLFRSLQQFVSYPRWMHGGVPTRSIFTHARMHIGHRMVATLDVKAFFPSVTEDHVRAVLRRFGITDVAQDACARLLVLDDQLPQGSPASCFLANLAFESADRQIDALCRRHRLSYGRYVDDIAISGDCDLRDFGGAIVSIVNGTGFVVASDKTLFMDQHERQVVTGLTVNNRLRPTREFVREVEAEIQICLADAGPAFLALRDGKSVRAVKQRLNGRVGHIGQADAKLGRRLRGRLAGVDWRSAAAELAQI